MNAMRKPILQKSSTGARKPLLTGMLAFCSALALTFSASGIAEEMPNAKGDISQEESPNFINGVALKIDDSLSTPAWRNNTSVITQIGNDNQARVEQVRDKSFEYGNYANIYQNGNGNEANIIQSGGNNIGLINQIGNDHQATIEQDRNGQAFDAQVSQSGNHSNIHVSQSGSGYRSISVSQSANSGAAAPVTIRTN